jgi:guanylate kinase
LSEGRGEGGEEGRRGFLVVISGPSGVGKTTVCERVLAETDGVRRSISSTTREPREGETHGRDYFFVSREEFQREVEQGRFLEHATVHGDLYGTHRAIVEDLTARGFDVLLNIDVQGGEQVRRSGMEAVLVFLMPPSDEELQRRLKARRTESPQDLARRLAAARNEMARASDYDHRVVNDDVERAAKEVRGIIAAHRDRSRR